MSVAGRSTPARGGSGVILAALLLASAGTAFAGGAGAGQDAPELRDARIRSVDVGADLGVTLAGLVAELPSPSWILYTVPAVPGRARLCGWRAQARVCRLEDGEGVVLVGDEAPEPAEDGRLRVLLRVAGGHIDRLRAFACSCTLDAGGLPVAWVRGVAAGASVHALGELAAGRGALGSLAADPDLVTSAVSAVALHDHAAALPLLVSWARDGAGELQRAAVFWLGAGRGREGVPALSELVRSHPDADVRERAAFALYVSDAPEAVDVLIQVAREDGDRGVRGQALLWLAQQAGERAVATLQGAVRDDPDLEVRKRAVFGLSQLPADRAIPLLIHIARTHPQPEVRKQAIFWLGQSGDERALDFIEELLRG